MAPPPQPPQRPYHRDHDRIVADLAAIREASGPAERGRLMEGFLRTYAPLIERVARMFGSRPRIDWRHDGGALVSVATDVAWRMLAEVGTPAETPPEAWPDTFRARVRSAIREAVESGEFTGFGGMTGDQRRKRSMRTSAAAFLAERGYHPSVPELVRYHNERVRARLANPVKQGALVSEDDLVERRIVPVDPDALSAQITYAVDETCPLAPWELSETMKAVFAACAEVSPRTAEIARVFAARMLADTAVSGATIGRSVGWSESTVNRELQTITAIAKKVIADRHGIGPGDL